MLTTRVFPPYGSGTDAPLIATNCVRMKLLPRSELLFGERLAAQTQHDHRDARRVGSQDQRRRDPVGSGRRSV